jgi:hypothetical protein
LEVVDKLTSNDHLTTQKSCLLSVKNVVKDLIKTVARDLVEAVVEDVEIEAAGEFLETLAEYISTLSVEL